MSVTLAHPSPPSQALKWMTHGYIFVTACCASKISEGELKNLQEGQAWIPLTVTPHFNILLPFFCIGPRAAHFCCCTLQGLLHSSRALPEVTKISHQWASSLQTFCPKDSSSAKSQSLSLHTFEILPFNFLISSSTPKICKPYYTTIVYVLKCDCFVFW